MTFDIFDTNHELSERAAETFVGQLSENPSLLLCAASGSSPEQAFRNINALYAHDPRVFADLRLIKLDEWGGIPMDHPASCEKYMSDFLVDPLHISEDRYFGVRSDPDDPEQECRRMNDVLDTVGPIDISILGLGVNGHLGMNEPALSLRPRCHVAELAESTLGHGMLAGVRPKYGMTLGMADIAGSRAVLLLVSGASKREPMCRLLEERIATDFPASLLWTHPNVRVLCSKDAWPK